MASLKAIRLGIKTTLETYIPGLHVYHRVPGALGLTPSVVVVPSPASSGRVANFDTSMGRGTDTWNFLLYVFPSMGDSDVSQDALDDLITGHGTKSIRQVIFEHQTLGLSNVNAHIEGILSYDTKVDFGSIDHTNAVLHLIVHTKGTE